MAKQAGSFSTSKHYDHDKGAEQREDGERRCPDSID